MAAFWSDALARFLVLYAALYAGFGVLSPYLPSLLGASDLHPEAIALVLAVGTAVRLAAGPVAGRLADRLDAPKIIMAICAAAAALIALAYPAARGLWPLLTVTLFQSAALAPLAPLSDTLAIGTAAPERPQNIVRQGFHYGWLRGAGSAAFIAGSVLSGQAIRQFGILAAVWLNAGLLAAAALAALRVPVLLPRRDASVYSATGESPRVSVLFRLPLFRRIVPIAALILGSHAMHDSFAVIRWRAAGIDAGSAGLLWSLSVAAEVVVFVFIGRSLLDRLGPAQAAMLAAVAGFVRWAVMAQTAWFPALALIEPLHGITFALLHLTCMRVLAQCIPPHLVATALTLYGTVGIGVPTVLLTLASGELYAHFGARGFWVMAALCAAALPLARSLRHPNGAPGSLPVG